MCPALKLYMVITSSLYVMHCDIYSIKEVISGIQFSLHSVFVNKPLFISFLVKYRTSIQTHVSGEVDWFQLQPSLTVIPNCTFL